MRMLRSNNGRSSLLTPSLNLDFGQGVMPQGLSFSRGSSATRFNASGLLETVSANVPRIDYDPVTLTCRGLLIEESRTNLLLYSDQLDNVYYNRGNAAISANVAISPDGTTNADKLVDNTTSGVHEISRAYSSTSGTNYVLSVFAKKAERGFLFLKTQDGNKGVGFNLNTGTVVNTQSASGRVAAFPNGWFRCFMFFTGNSTTTSTVEIGAGSSTADWSANGDYRYVGDGGGIYLYGADFQIGSFETSYIPTTSATVTRSADVCTITPIAWYNQNGGTFLINYQLLPGQTNAYTDAFTVNAGSGAHEIVLYTRYTGSITLNAPVNGVYAGQIQASYVPGSFSNPFKIAVAVSNSSSAIAVNGIVTNANAGTLPTGLNQIGLGRARNNSAGEYLNGWVSRFSGYMNRLPNSSIQLLTS